MEPSELVDLCRRTRPDWPETCTYAVQRLRGLARWLLAPGVLAAARRDAHASPEVQALAEPPALAGGPGSATVLCVVCHPELRGRLLGEALALPVRWQRDAEPDPALPGGLREVAERVTLALKLDRRYGLRLDADRIGRSFPSLQAWPVRGESSFCALAAALWVLDAGGKARADVLASAGWTVHGGVQAVGGVQAKVQLAARLGARKVYLASQDLELGRPLAEWRLELHPLPTVSVRGQPDLLASLEPLLRALDAPPPPQAPLEERLRYHARIPRGPTQQQYYTDVLLADLLAACRQRGVENWPPGQKLKCLVTFSSHSPWVSLFAIWALCPARVLMLHTDRTTPQAARECQWLHEHCPELHLQTERVADETEVARAVRAFCDQVPPEQVGADLTPGPKWYTAGVLAALPHSPLFYLEQPRWEQEHRPGEERLRRLQLAEPLPPAPAGPGTNSGLPPLPAPPAQ